MFLSCFCKHLSQAFRPHGSSLPCATPGAVPLEDETHWDPPNRTSLSLSKGVSQLLLRTFSVTGPPLSLERGQYGFCSPLPNGNEGCLSDGLEHGLRGQVSMQSLARRVSLLAKKQPGAESHLSATDTHFLPSLKGCHVIVRMDNMAVVSHINCQRGSQSRILDRHDCHLLLCSRFSV